MSLVMEMLTAMTSKTQVTTADKRQARVNHATSEQNITSNEVKSSVIKKLSFNNQDTGSQFNIGKGTQNIATGGIQIVGLISTGNVYFGTMKEESRDDIIQKIRVWLLGNLLTDERYETSIRKRLDNTCDWILHNPKFEKWRSVSSSSPKMPKLLWINGPPGFGKTVLCARIIKYIKEEKKEIVAHYFFSSDLESCRDPMVAMRSWIYHMASMNDLVKHAAKKTLGRGVEASKTVTIDLFRKAIKMLPSCTLVIDGLDKCAPGNSYLSVVEFIKEINKAVHGTDTRILVMSENKDYIRQAMMEVESAEFSEYGVCKDDVRSDIYALSKDIVAKKLRDKDAAIQDEIATKMSHQSEGQFLWLKLQQDSLGKGLSQQQLQDAVEAIPADLSALYARDWSLITERNDQKRVISLLRLAVFSLRPLTVREISEAVLVSEECEDFPIRELPDRWDERYVKEKILDLCCSFLERRKQSPKSPVEEWTIHPRHFVKEFLLTILHQTSQGGNRSMIADEHNFLAKLCITYMKYSYAWRDSTGNESPCSGSFTKYAAKFWNQHVKAGDAQQNTWVENFFDENSLSCAMWRKWFNSTHDGWNSGKGDPAIPLCYAIELGFVDLASAIIMTGKVHVNYNSSNRTALGVACSKGYENLALKLLANGAKVGIRDAYGRTAVHYAAMNGHLEIVKLLVKNGADIKINRDNQGRTALYYAAMNDYLEMVKLLIDNGADIKIRDHNGLSPFLAASANGHLNTMRQLIQKGADVCQLDKCGHDALFKAVLNGHIKVVRFLIGRGAHRQLSSYLTTPPVFVAVGSGSSQLARLLIDQEKDINIRSGIKKPTILHVAISEGKTDIVKLLIDRRVNVMLQDDDGRTPLFTACFNGHVDIAKLLLKHGADPAIATIDTRQTPLFAACCKGHVEIVKLLIENEVNIMTPDKEGKTPLYTACVNRHSEVALLLIDNGADISVPDTIEDTQLSVAVFEGSFPIVKTLIEKAANVSAAACNRAILAASQEGHVDIVQLLIDSIDEEIQNLNYKWTLDDNTSEYNIRDAALLLASGQGQADVVELLLNYGADIKKSDPRGRAALYTACYNGHVDVAKLLIERGADIEAKEGKGHTPLMAACANGRLDLVELLLQKGADIKALSKSGTYAAYEAAQCGQLEVLRLLLSRGADVLKPNEQRMLPIHVASENDHAKTVDLLIKNGSDVAAANEDGKTPLWLASFYGRVDVVNVLLSHGVDVDARDSNGQTSLFIASCKGKIKLAKLLLDNCASVSITDNEGRTALFCASENGHLDIVKLLLDNGADITPDNKGQTPAYIASAMGHIDVLRLLIEFGADITVSDDQGCTLLHASCLSGRIEPTKLLLKVGADINSCNKEGFCPLNSALVNDHVAIAEHLIRNGADLSKQGNDGRSAIVIASTNGHIKIVELLIERGVDVQRPDGNGKPPLTAACEAGHVQIVRYLVDKGSTINSAVKDTPLSAACLYGHIEVVEFLLKLDVKMKVIGPNELTHAEAIASQKNYTKLYGLLRTHSAQMNNKGNLKEEEQERKIWNLLISMMGLVSIIVYTMLGKYMY